MRRFVLLAVGIVGGVLAAGVLCISAEDVLKPPATIVGDSPEELVAEITLPINVPGTELIAQKLSAYEGPFLEDGTDREVVNVAALHLYNGSSSVILKAHIELQCENGVYVFEGDHIPPKSTVVILEQNAAAYRRESFLACRGWQETQQNQSAQSLISVSDMAMGTIIVTNMTDRIFRDVCIYYKSWLSPPDIYIGGITYMVQMPVLLPGQTKYLYQSHYASGYSKVVSVTKETVCYTAY